MRKFGFVLAGSVFIGTSAGWATAGFDIPPPSLMVTSI